MASKVLAELSSANTYLPQSVQSSAGGLQKRRPLATPAGQVAEPTPQALLPRRNQRTATDVRTMLSGYQAGVERGRTSPQLSDIEP